MASSKSTGKKSKKKKRKTAKDYFHNEMIHLEKRIDDFYTNISKAEKTMETLIKSLDECRKYLVRSLDGKIIEPKKEKYGEGRKF